MRARTDLSDTKHASVLESCKKENGNEPWVP